MDYGVVMFATDYAIPPDELARALEERGFESLWVPEHTHIPASRRTPFPGGGSCRGNTGPPTTPSSPSRPRRPRRVGSSSGPASVSWWSATPSPPPRRWPPSTASPSGRFLFGIGGGWNAEEMEHHGTAFKTRWRVLRERILAMKEIWTKEEAEFHGQFVNFDRIWSHPKPVQKPHPPVVMGGDGPGTFDRVVEFGDGWMPICGRGATPSSASPSSASGSSAPAAIPGRRRCRSSSPRPGSQSWRPSPPPGWRERSSACRRIPATRCCPASTATRPSSGDPPGAGRPHPPPTEAST